MTQADAREGESASPSTSGTAARPGAQLAWAVGALAVAVVLAATFPAWADRVPAAVEFVASYALTWLPLAIALGATATFWRGYLRFRPSDVLLGLALGVVARGVGIIVQFFVTGRLPSAGVLIGGVSAAYVTSAVIAVLLAPLIEEPFFRGLLQGSLGRFIGPWPSVVITAVVFAVVHVFADGWSVTLIVEMLVYALLAGIATQQTKRLGPALIAHAAFNGLAVLISWPW